MVDLALDGHSASKFWSSLSRFGRMPFTEIPKDSFGIRNATQILDFHECGQLNSQVFDTQDLLDSRSAKIERIVVPTCDGDPLLVYTDDGGGVSADRAICSLGPSAQWTLDGKAFLRPYMWAGGSTHVMP